MAWYRAGTIAIANGSTTVTGTNTNFTDTAAGPNPGDMLIVGVGTNLRIYEIQAVNSATKLTLATAATVEVAAGSTYQIQTSVATSNSGLAKKISATMDRMLNSIQNWMTILNGTGNVTITDYEGKTATNRSWPAMNTAIDGRVADTGDTMTGELVIDQGTGGKIVAGTGRLELYAKTPFVDFHFDNSTADYTARIIHSEAQAIEVSAASGGISFRINGGLRVGGASYSGGINIYRGNGDANALWGINVNDGNFNFARGSAAGADINLANARVTNLQGIQSRAGSSGTQTGNMYNIFWNGVATLYVDTSRLGVFAYDTSSDRQLKKEITYRDDDDAALEEVMQWKPATFIMMQRGIVPESGVQLGVIANDLKAVSPECVGGLGLPDDYDIENDPNNPDAYYLNQVPMIVKLAQSVKSLRRQVAELQQQLSEK